MLFRSAFEMIAELRNMYQEPARVEKHRVVMQLYGCKMAEGASVRTHVQKMMGLLEQLGKLGYNIELEQATYLILFSLPPSFSMFVMNYYMAGELKQLNELYSMLATAETTFKKSPEILAVSKDNRKIGKKGKGKKKSKTGRKGRAPAGSKVNPKPVKMSTPTADTVCFHYNDK